MDDKLKTAIANQFKNTELGFLRIKNNLNIAHFSDETPEATMGSRLYTDTKQPDSRFRRIDKNIFSLKEMLSSDIAQRVDSINRKTRSKLKIDS